VLAAIPVDPVEQRGGDGVGRRAVTRKDVLDGRVEGGADDAERIAGGGLRR
jgi:hypothetical protein